MSIGKVIRKYRKEKNMTQEEMALRLGVTAPAVNKWENENSFPDITLLAPIARLLGISLDTLLSFREGLTQEEINGVIYELDERLKTAPYEECFRWAKEKLEQYPNCEGLMVSVAVVLEAQLMLQEISDREGYEEYIVSLYDRVLPSGDEALRIRAADSLFALYMRKKQYDRAETYLKYFSLQNPNKKFRQAQIFEGTGRTKEAYKEYEELLFESYGRVSLTLNGMYMLALKEEDMERAHKLVEKQRELAVCFEMGRYHEVSAGLELAMLKKDADTAAGIRQELLDAIPQIDAFRHSFLYEHIEFKEVREDFVEKLREKLLEGFREEET